MGAAAFRPEARGRDRLVPDPTRARPATPAAPHQPERDPIITVGGHVFEVFVPGFARIDAKLLARFAGQELPGALDVVGGERSAVVPFDALAQGKAELFAILAPRPAGGELRDDRFKAALRHMLVIKGEVVEHPNHRHRG